MIGTIQLGAIGVDFIVTAKDPNTGNAVNLAGATTRNFILTKPDNSSVTKAAAFLTDGSDGKLHYVTLPGDIDQIGQWSIQEDLVVPSIGYTGKTTIGQFSVGPNL